MLAVQLPLRHGFCDVRGSDCMGNISTNDTSRRHFDPDTRDLVQVRVVHGSWKREDPNGIHIEVNPRLSFLSRSFKYSPKNGLLAFRFHISMDSNQTKMALLLNHKILDQMFGIFSQRLPRVRAMRLKYNIVHNYRAL